MISNDNEYIMPGMLKTLQQFYSSKCIVFY